MAGHLGKVQGSGVRVGVPGIRVEGSWFGVA